MKKLLFSLITFAVIGCGALRADEAVAVEAQPEAEKVATQETSFETTFWGAMNEAYAQKFAETHHNIEAELQKIAEGQGDLFEQMLAKYGQKVTTPEGKEVLALAVPVLFVLQKPAA